MDLDSQTIHDVIHPTAILNSSNKDHTHSFETQADALFSPWEDSQLNPKNRIDSLDPPKSPLWRIDGSAGLGTQFYAVPLFLDGVPPMRFDVFVAVEATKSSLIRKLLDLDSAFHSRDGARVQRQGICSYVLRTLQHWTKEVYGIDKTRNLYYQQPFGSRIVFNNLPLNTRNVDIQLVPMHNLETHQESLAELKDKWQLDMPPTLDIYDLVFVRQLHDSVCIVRYRDTSGSLDEPRLWVLKALISSVKFMYHELRILLSMPPHPNVVARPTKLVTKKTRNNEKREVVVGFMMPFYSGGGLRDELPLLRMSQRLHLADQFYWATEISSALLHLRQKARVFYPDLRLDQVVLSSDDKRPVILDFEQRGVWCEFASPEVNALEYARILALGENEPDDHISGTVDESSLISQHFAKILNRFLPGWTQLCGNDKHYDNPPQGYNVPWLCLSRREQEYAEVYMLGRLLWCIFEGMSSPQRGAVWQSYLNEPVFDFPVFERTPVELRALIDRCTSGRRDQLSNHVIRKESKIVLRDDPRGDGTEEMIRSVAKDFWMKEVKWAEEFLLDREERLAKGIWEENIYGRPTLSEVYETLKEVQKGVLGGV